MNNLLYQMANLADEYTLLYLKKQQSKSISEGIKFDIRMKEIEKELQSNVLITVSDGKNKRITN